MVVAVYPGSFDPITNGHLNIIQRASKIFDEVIVVVGINTGKQSMFTAEQRVNFIEESVADLKNVSVKTETGLTVEFLKKVKANIIIRGLRNSADFELEKKMAQMNHYLDEHVETLFMVADSKYDFVASSLLKEVVHFKGSILELVPAVVADALESGKFEDTRK
ncbi:phosphopantetheine adenylyltransferase [Secundilactobacillus oryzae JCM 18671]|uniref:Phosphopantetheine adenylyltransferase n=1 Tax=Secundilactobacillus oryzae JCM 18671 TaxID=1291743 RepID=A0A081BGS4_9LACO|nr:pantetheine-phosphate adenylyltransferase [Secundilactobacillus oryzae]GAK47242.1 phosphopantetheine adenylyltransferase [Secundilactobacillus oryzae JCM 18671]